ncbi:MAG: insulinase family protein [Deltaproteobacteria bacterium]|nr:MAG: insulinase family protein [Deltaproteobacteria bacterium]
MTRVSIQKSVLPNGVRILTMPMPHIHSVSMGIWVNAGSRDETPAEQGLSHFIEHMIFKGTRRRSAHQIAKEFDAIGGGTNAFTSMENTCYHAKVMRAHMPTMIDILSDIFLNSVFDQQEMDRERPVIFQEIGMLEDSPDELVHHLAGQNFWGDHPLGHPITGTRENLARFDSSDLKNFFRKLYQPDQIILSAAGRVDHQAFLDHVQPAFEALTSVGKLPRRKKPTSHFRTRIHPRDQEQIHLCIGNRGEAITSPDRYTLSLLNTILGGNMSSRLFQEIREACGLAYSIYSFVSAFMDAGMFGIYAAVSPAHAVETVERILKALQKLKQEPVTADELKSAKEYTKSALLLSTESNDNQMIRMAQQEFHFHRYIPLDEIVDCIDQVSAEDILALSERLFDRNQIALTSLGPVSDTDLFSDLLKQDA